MEHCAKVLGKDPTDFKAQNLYQKGQVSSVPWILRASTSFDGLYNIYQAAGPPTFKYLKLKLWLTLMLYISAEIWLIT
jgi:hypothetical protein